MGVFKDKEYEKIVHILCPSAERMYTLDLPNKERTLAGREAGRMCKRLYVRTVESVYRPSKQSVGGCK